MKPRHRPASVHAQIPPGCRTPTRGAKLVRLAQNDGVRAFDRSEAFARMSPQHWAYAFRDVLRYLGASRSLHVWELLPEDEARVARAVRR